MSFRVEPRVRLFSACPDEERAAFAGARRGEESFWDVDRRQTEFSPWAEASFSSSAQICTQGQVMFLACSASMVCAVCVARFLNGSWTLFEKSSCTVQRKRDIRARVRESRPRNHNF